MKTLRNPNIELWRCFCMFAVVLGHVLVNNHVCTMNGYLWHIPGFLLISGYFGIRFSFYKVAKLLGIAYALYWMTIPFRPWSGFAPLFVPHGGWFLPFYCILMLLSPLLNAALESVKSQKSILVVVVSLVFIGWIPTMSGNPHVKMIAVPGMQGNGLLLMVSTYVFGAMLRKYELCRRFHFTVWLILFVIGICSCIGMGMWIPSACHFLSPISIATSAFGMMFFLSLPALPVMVGKTVNFIAPSMFGVYLLHEICIRGWQYFAKNNGGGAIDAIIRCSILFLVCVGIDLVRRMLVNGVTRLSQGLLDRGHGVGVSTEELVRRG